MLGQEGASLRHAAAELGHSVTTLGIEAARRGLPVDRRPKNITEKVRSDVCNSLRRGLAPKEVAEAHGISQVSVYRILRMDKALAREWADQGFRRRRDACRERFASQASPTRANYAWLYRNDRQWLIEQQAAASKGKTLRKPYIDWAERDKFLAQQVAEHSDSMRNALGRPQWISRSALERATGLADTIERNPDKLPRTHLTLSAHSESHEEYQGRQLQWAAAKLKKSLHGAPPRWQLLRLAGIRILAESNEQLLGTLTS
jgi:hypothetical protein